MFLFIYIPQAFATQKRTEHMIELTSPMLNERIHVPANSLLLVIVPINIKIIEMNAVKAEISETAAVE